MRMDGKALTGAGSGCPGWRGLTAATPLFIALMVAWMFFAAGNGGAMAQTAVLTEGQEALARKIDEILIAPCCFRGTLAEHRSEISDELREQVRQMVAGGATEEAIIDYFVDKYGQKILAAPRARGFNLLAYLVPFLGLAAGLTLIVMFVRRAEKRVPISAVSVTPPVCADESLRARVLQELDRFES